MTQTNNEREALDVRYFNEKLRLVLEGLPNYTRSELARELQRLSNTASPISHNEQQEVVGEIKIVLIGANDVSAIEWSDKYRPKVGDKLYTSPPKQAIPDGYSTDDEHFASTLNELAEQFIDSYEAGDVIKIHLSKDLGSREYKYRFDATGKPFLEPITAPTNTEVGNDR